MDKAERQNSAVGVEIALSNVAFRTLFFRILTSVSCLLLLASCSLPRILILDDTLSAEEHLNLGVAYEKKGEYDPAIEEYKKASKKIMRAYVHLGNVYFQKGEFGKAEDSYRKAIDREPTLADAYNNLAWLYYTKRENLPEAESLASKAVELDPPNETYRDTLNRIREVK